MSRGVGVGWAAIAVVGALVLGLVAWSASAHAGSGPRGGSGPGSPAATLARNRAAARADAREMLTQITLPAGATRLGPFSGMPPLISLTPTSARDEIRWRLPADTFRQAIAEVESHRPADVASTYTESAGDRSGLTSLTVGYILRNVRPDEIDDRVVQVTAAPDSTGTSTVTIESESVWVVPRSAASTIPDTTRLITLSLTTPKGHVLRSATLSAAARVHATVRFFNGLGADQPFTINCPAEFLDDTITVTFLRRTGEARPLARAGYDDDSDGQAGECDAVQLTVGGARQNALLSPSYVRSLERLFGLRLPSRAAPITGLAGS